MKTKLTMLALCFVVASSLLLQGCDQRPTLNVYTWADYIKPEIVEQFEKDNNCKVVIDTFDSNESMYAKVNAGASGYDIIMPTTYMVKLMRQQGMVHDIDLKQFPNAGNVDKEYLRMSPDSKMQYSVPYACGASGLAYNKKDVSNFAPSWAMFDRSDMKGRMTILNDMRESIGAALKFLGYSTNTKSEKELEEAKQVLIRWKKNIAKFESEQYKTGIASGEFLVVQGYSGDSLQLQEDNEDIGFDIPKEGTSITCDEMIIPATSKQVELAHKFINYMHDGEVARQNTEFTKFLCPNSASYPNLDSSIKENPAIFLKPEVRAKCEMMDDLGEDNAKYVRVWDEVKAAD